MSLPTPAPLARAVVTGASSGIGTALARQLAARGHALVLVARRRDRLKELADELSTAYGVQVEVRPCDLADRTARSELAAELANRQISILCNNAGFATFGDLRDADPAREREQLEVNAVAVQELTLAVLPGMHDRGRGAILIVGSTAGHQPFPGNATYAASKAFANTFAESLHTELAGTGVTCTLLAPGPVRTEFSAVAGIERIEGFGGRLTWVTADQVAKQAIDALDHGRRTVVPGLFAKLETLGGRYTPRTVLLPMLHLASRGLR